jgi:hypothetical protein
MAITAAYIKSLEDQKKLISQLGSSGPQIPGLNVEQIAKTLAELDQNLGETIKYYKDQAEQEAAKEEQQQADAGVVETDEQKRARRQKKAQEALQKGEDIVKKYVDAQRDFIQEQISIIEVNYGVIGKEITELPKTIALASTTSLQPAALGAAAPNPIFNLGLLYQTIKSIRRSVGGIKTAFLNMLIAADKIKFALPSEITGLLQSILNIEETLGSSGPSDSEVDQLPPPTPPGTQVTLKAGEYRLSSSPNYAIVSAKDLVQARENQPGRILETIKDANGVVIGIRIEIVPAIPDFNQTGGDNGSSDFTTDGREMV